MRTQVSMQGLMAATVVATKLVIGMRPSAACLLCRH